MRAKTLKQLIEIVEQSNIGELEISRWGTKIRISKTGSGVAVNPVPGQFVPASTPVPIATVIPSVSETVESGSFLEVKSPMVGTFYEAPSPEAAAFVKLGDTISPGNILCIIEAMKLMNEIESEVSGKIVKILVENGTPVDYGQPLFLIEPA